VPFGSVGDAMDELVRLVAVCTSSVRVCGLTGQSRDPLRGVSVIWRSRRCEGLRA
jgi:hypothetical protein